jgi:hypothetical protein
VLPEHVIIDGLLWEITMSPAEDYGVTSPRDCRIIINPELQEQLQEQTFWHEIVHAFFATREREHGKKFSEEEVARIVGPSLYAFIQANLTLEWKTDAQEKTASPKSTKLGS